MLIKKQSGGYVLMKQRRLNSIFDRVLSILLVTSPPEFLVAIGFAMGSILEHGRGRIVLLIQACGVQM